MKYSNTEEGISGRKSDCGTKNTLIWIALALIVVAAAGCVSKPSDVTKNETITTPVATDMPVTTSTPIPTDVTPSTGPTGFDAPAPYQLYIKAGQIYQFTYGIYERRNFTINYISAYPTQIVKITFDGYEKIIQKEIYDSPTGIYWSEGKFGFTLKPVVWEMRDSQQIPKYGRTWNTTELYFEVLNRR